MTTMKVITRAEERTRVLSCVREARGNGECGFYYNENRDMYDMFNFREVVNEFKRFNIIKRRKGHRFNDDNIPPLHIHAIDHNNQTKIIDGKPVYIMVLQHEHSSINPIGFGLDKTFLVSGWIYCFFDEKIRDTLFKKFFLLEEPKPVIPTPVIPTPVIPTPVIPTPKIKKNKKPKKCVACKSPALLKCGKCRRACYCGVECQRSDWLHHKEICEGCN